MQKLTPIVEPHFSEYSYGFRPKRRAQQAIVKLLEYFNDGYTYVVDIDLEKFFDNVPQDKLMTLVGKLIQDPDTESLIRKYLNAGVMVEGRYEETRKGTPQGGNLSPLLSNIMLNELDKELEARGLHFVRYADDCVIAVGSSAAANRVIRTLADCNANDLVFLNSVFPKHRHIGKNSVTNSVSNTSIFVINLTQADSVSVIINTNI